MKELLFVIIVMLLTPLERKPIDKQIPTPPSIMVGFRKGKEVEDTNILKELYSKVQNEIPKEIGVYTYKNKYLTLVKKSRKQKLIEGMDGELNYGMIRALNREREKQRDKIKLTYYNNLQNYIYNLQDIIKSRKDRVWNLKHHEIGKKREINELEIEIDVLYDVYRELKSII